MLGLPPMTRRAQVPAVQHDGQSLIPESSLSPRRIGWVWAALAVGASLLFAAFHTPVEYTATGGRTLEGWFVAIIGLSATLGIFTWPTVWRRAGLLTSLFILVSSAELGLTFPHWAMSLRVTPDQLERPEHYFAIAVVGITWLVAIVLTAPVARDTLRLARSVLTPMRALFLSAVFLVTAANVAAYYPQLFEGGYQAEKYVRWLVAAGSFLALNILVLWHLARALPSAQLKALSERITRWISLPGEEGPTKPLDAWVPWGLSIFVLAVTVFFARVVLAGTAQFSDEVVYQFMADVYASGALRAPAPPVPEAFEMYMVEVGDGLRYGVFIPGWPLVLAIGAFFGIPWLVNPVLGALSVPAAHALTRRLTDRGTAHVVALLMATSPWFVILSSVYQPHAVTLLTALLTWLGMHHAKTHGGHAWALMAGLAAGVAFSVRPLDGLVIGGAAGLFAILKVGGRRAHLKLFAIYLFGCLATGSVSLWINHALTGDALTYASNVYFDRVWGVGANRLGFGPDVGRVWGGLDPIPGHGIPDVLFNVNLNLFTLNYEMLGWGIGSLFLAVLHLAWGRLSRIDRVAIAFIVGAISIYSLYWFNGGPDTVHGTGTRRSFHCCCCPRGDLAPSSISSERERPPLCPVHAWGSWWAYSPSPESSSTALGGLSASTLTTAPRRHSLRNSSRAEHSVLTGLSWSQAKMKVSTPLLS